MKNVILGLILAFVAVPAFAGSCESGSCGVTNSRPVASATVNVGRRVVTAPVRVFSVLRARVAARRSARSVRVGSGCSAAGCN